MLGIETFISCGPIKYEEKKLLTNIQMISFNFYWSFFSDIIGACDFENDEQCSGCMLAVGARPVYSQYQKYVYWHRVWNVDQIHHPPIKGKGLKNVLVLASAWLSFRLFRQSPVDSFIQFVIWFYVLHLIFLYL